MADVTVNPRGVVRFKGRKVCSTDNFLTPIRDADRTIWVNDTVPVSFVGDRIYIYHLLVQEGEHVCVPLSEPHEQSRLQTSFGPRRSYPGT